MFFSHPFMLSIIANSRPAGYIGWWSIHRAIELTQSSVLWSSSKNFFEFTIIDARERETKSRKSLLCLLRHSAMNGMPSRNELTHAVTYEPQQPGGSEELTNNCNFHVGSFDATELMMNEKLNLHRSISYQYPYICSLWAMMSVIIDWREIPKNLQLLTVSQPFKFNLLEIFYSEVVIIINSFVHTFHIFSNKPFSRLKHESTEISESVTVQCKF